MIRSPFLLGQPVCETETDGVMVNVCNAGISTKPYFGQAINNTDNQLDATVTVY